MVVNANAEYHRESLDQACLEMLNLCKSQFEKSIEAFLNHDSDLAEEVIHRENRVNASDLKIEKDCERFLALYNPVASDLRFIMSIRKINFDLERIGDHAYSVGRYVVDFDKKQPQNLLTAVDFEGMVDILFSMLEHVVIAYENKDVKEARRVFKKDKALDSINNASFSAIESEIKKDTAVIGHALVLFSVLKKIERVGDLLKNVAEEIIFYIDAEVIKHKKKK